MSVTRHKDYFNDKLLMSQRATNQYRKGTTHNHGLRLFVSHTYVSQLCITTSVIVGLKNHNKKTHLSIVFSDSKPSRKIQPPLTFEEKKTNNLIMRRLFGVRAPVKSNK